MPDLEARFRIVRELPPPDLWPDIESREPRPGSEPPWRRLGVAALAVVVATGGLVVVVRAFTAPEPREELPAADPRVTATIPVGPFPRAIAAGEGGVWVVVPGNDTDGGYEGTVERIDPSTNEVVASIPVDTGDAVAAGAGSVWVTGVTNTVGPSGQTSDFKGVVLRIDPATNRVVDRIPYQGGSPYDIAADASGVWVAQSTGNRSGAILHLDPETGEEVAAIPVADVPYTVTTGEGYVWALLGPRGLVKIDPTTDEVVATIDVNPVPFEMAVGEGSVWVQSWLSAFDPGVGTESEDRLVAVRVDARTNEFDQPVVFEEGFRPVVVSEGGVWFLGGSPSGQGLTIGRLDPTANEVDASAALPGIDLAQRNFVAFDDSSGSIWIANYRDSVTRIDLAAPTNGDGSPLEAEGTSLLLPAGWHGRADSLSGYTRRIFQAATFPLPPLADIEATDARTGIGPSDILIVLHEFTRRLPPVPVGLVRPANRPPPGRLRRSDGGSEWLPPLVDVPSDHGLARRIFNLGFRYFDVRVEFGRVPATQETLERVNAVLASLTIGDWVPELNGICQWNELGMRDPD